MENVIVAIYSNDLDYSLALGEALSLLNPNFLINVTESSQAFKECGQYDLLLLEDDEMVFPDVGRSVIRLVNDRSSAIKNLDSLSFKLFKYESVRSIAADIILYDRLLTGRVAFGFKNKGYKMIAICSCRGGAGKTTVAMGLGQALCRYHGKKVLYISLEEVESTLLYINRREGGLSIGEYLYYLFKDETKTPDQESFMIWDSYGINAFKPDKGKNRLKELNKDQLAAFFNAVTAEGRYDYVLADLGDHFSDESLWMIRQCDKIVSIVSEPQRQSERQERFTAYLRFALGNRVESDLICVHNMNRTKEDATFSFAEDICIDYDPDSIAADGDIYSISIDQDFGIGIKALSQKLIKS